MDEETKEFLRKKDIEADISRLSISQHKKVYLHDINFLKYLNTNDFTKNKYKKPMVLSYSNLVELFRLNLITNIRNGTFSIEYLYQKLLDESLKHMSQIKNYYKTDMAVVEDKQNNINILVNIFDTTSPSDLTIDEYDVLKKTLYKNSEHKKITYKNNKSLVPLLTNYGLQENLNYFQSRRNCYLIGELFNSSDGTVKLPRNPSNGKCIIEFIATNSILKKCKSEFRIISNKKQSIKHVFHNKIVFDENKPCEEVIIKNLKLGDKVKCYLINQLGDISNWIITIYQPGLVNKGDVKKIYNQKQQPVVVKYLKFKPGLKNIKYINLHALLKIGFISHSLIKTNKQFFIYYPIQKVGKQIYYDIKLVLPTISKKSDTLIFRFGDISGLKGRKYLELEFEKNTNEEEPGITNDLIVYSKNNIQIRKKVKIVKLPLNQFRRGDYIKLICKKDNTDIYKDSDDKGIELNNITKNQTTWICIIKKKNGLNENHIYEEKDIDDRRKKILVNTLVKRTIILNADINKTIMKGLSHPDNTYNIIESDNNSIIYVKMNNFNIDLSQLESETVYRLKLCFNKKNMKLNIIDDNYKIINNFTNGSNLVINSKYKNQIINLYYVKKQNLILIN